MIKSAFHVWLFGAFLFVGWFDCLLLFSSPKKCVPVSRYSTHICIEHWSILLAFQAPVAISCRCITPLPWGLGQLLEMKVVKLFLLFLLHPILQWQHGFCSDLLETA